MKRIYLIAATAAAITPAAVLAQQAGSTGHATIMAPAGPVPRESSYHTQWARPSPKPKKTVASDTTTTTTTVATTDESKDKKKPKD